MQKRGVRSAAHSGPRSCLRLPAAQPGSQRLPAGPAWAQRLSHVCGRPLTDRGRRMRQRGDPCRTLRLSPGGYQASPSQVAVPARLSQAHRHTYKHARTAPQKPSSFRREPESCTLRAEGRASTVTRGNSLIPGLCQEHRNPRGAQHLPSQVSRPKSSQMSLSQPRQGCTAHPDLWQTILQKYAGTRQNRLEGFSPD